MAQQAALHITVAWYITVAHNKWHGTQHKRHSTPHEAWHITRIAMAHNKDGNDTTIWQWHITIWRGGISIYDRGSGGRQYKRKMQNISGQKMPSKKRRS
jgi:hypothetical protein